MADAGLLSLSFLVPVLLVVLAMPVYMKFLVRSGRVVDDAHKRPVTKVPSPAGPLLFVGAVAGEVVVYLAFGSLVPVAIMGAAAVAFLVGLADDFFVAGGKTKPLLLLLAGLPLIASVLVQPDLYQSSLTFPILGDTAEHFSIFAVLVVVSFPIVSNAFNMMDSFNGEVSWFAVLTSLALTFGVALRTVYTPGLSPVRLAATLPLLAIAIGFLAFNRFPSKVFDGNSGALMFGSMFAGLAIVDGVEIAAVIAILPAILNSFYTLSSLRGFVERRKMAARPTYVGEDGMMYASGEPSAPNTIVRLILLAGPLDERALVRDILILTAVACLLSTVVSFLTWVY